MLFPRCLPPLLLFVASVVPFIASVVPLASGQGILPINEADLDPALLQPLFIDVTVVEKGTGEPIEKAAVELKAYVKRQQVNRREETDGRGRCELKLPESGKMSSLTVEARVDGFVPIHMRWDGYNQKLEAPNSLRLEFEPAVTVGGVVQDSAGKPIEGVRVTAHIRANSTGNGVGDFYFSIAELQTTEDGRWRIDTCPQDVSQLSVSFKHDEYQSGHTGGGNERSSLLKLQSVQTLTRGAVVTGRVLDGEGQPIVGATVTHGDSQFSSNLRKAKTEANGHFKLLNCEPGVLPVTVQVRGYAPDLQNVNVPGASRHRRVLASPGGAFSANVSEEPKSPSEPLEFRLKRAAKLVVRVVDENGEPLNGVGIAADTWRGHRCLSMRKKTNNLGLVEWLHAPHDEVLYDLFARGRMSVRKQAIPADGQQHTITMLPVAKLTGTVVDAQTGKPISKFRVMRGLRFKNNPRTHWQQHESGEFTGGEFALQYNEPYDGAQLRVEAAGYRLTDSKVFDLRSGDRQFEFKLEKGKPLVGMVINAAGEPVSGADVVLLSKDFQYLQINQGAYRPQQAEPHTKSDAQGRFEFSDQPAGARVVVVIYDQGLASLLTDRTHGELKPIKLRAWGRVRGQLMIGDKAGAGETVSYYATHNGHGPEAWIRGLGVVDTDLLADQKKADNKGDDKPSAGKSVPADIKAAKNLISSLSSFFQGRPPASPAAVMAQGLQINVWHNNQVTTDAQGRFEFTKVVPGEFGVSRLLMSKWGQFTMQTHAATAKGKVAPGEQATVQIGGVGRPVIGQLATPNKAPDGFSWNATQPANLISHGGASFSASIGADGTFRFEDVPPGSYTLKAQIGDPNKFDKWQQPEIIAMANRTVEVPAPDGDAQWSAEPHDLGEIQPTPRGGSPSSLLRAIGR